MTDSHDAPQIDETRLRAIRRRIEEVAGDAPQLAKLALEQMMTKHNPDLKGSAGSAGRIGAQSGNVSELTAIARLKPGGAERLRRIFGLVNGNFDGAQKVGTLHDMRFAFFDDDTRILFATTYDGDWDTYINDFATKIPDLMDLLFQSVDGRGSRARKSRTSSPDIRSPRPAGSWPTHRSRSSTCAGSSAWSARSTNSWTRWVEACRSSNDSHRASAETPSRWSSTTSRR
jgi:hypothetical protein